MGDNHLPENSVLDVSELRRLGVTRHQISRLIDQGLLHRVERGLYTSAPPQGELLLHALAARRPELVFSGLTAVQLHSGTEITSPVTARVPYGCAAKTTPFVRVRQSRVLHHQMINGFRAVTPIAAVADLPEHDETELIRFLELRYRGRHGRPTLERDIAALGRAPASVRHLVSRSSIGADSESERRVFRALKRRGVDVLQNYLIGPYLWDGVIPDEKVAIEIDSYRYHGLGPNGENHQTFVKDRWKANYAVREGYRVLRFTGECVYHHLKAVLDEIMAEVENAPSRDTAVWNWHSAWLFPEMMGDSWED